MSTQDNASSPHRTMRRFQRAQCAVSDVDNVFFPKGSTCRFQIDTVSLLSTTIRLYRNDRAETSAPNLRAEMSAPWRFQARN